MDENGTAAWNCAGRVLLRHQGALGSLSSSSAGSWANLAVVTTSPRLWEYWRNGATCQGLNILAEGLSKWGMKTLQVIQNIRQDFRSLNPVPWFTSGQVIDLTCFGQGEGVNLSHTNFRDNISNITNTWVMVRAAKMGIIRRIKKASLYAQLQPIHGNQRTPVLLIMASKASIYIYIYSSINWLSCKLKNSAHLHL